MHPLVLIGGLATALALPAARQDDTRARLVYEHAGTIYSIASDGSDRRPVTAGSGPVPSPGGDALAFVRIHGEDQASIWLSAPDGTQAHELPGSADAASYPAWSPDGSRIAFARAAIGDDALESSIVVMRRDGGEARTVVRLHATAALFVVTAPVWTPDGQRLLYTRSRAAKETTYGFDVHSVALDGGGDAVFLRDAYGGAFSPDGARLAFADSSRVDGTNCGSDECYPNGELAVAAADGSGRRVLLRTRADESDPRWSSDGTRIAFSSGRNNPVDEGDPEVYTIAPDGSCLTWLTNGTPGSGAPAWLPGPGTAAPPACGADRAPLVETTAPKSARGAWWVGSRMGTALLSDVQGRGRTTSFSYQDCAAFDPKRCRPLFLLGQSDTCRPPANLKYELRDLVGARRVRGGAILTDGHAGAHGVILTGRSLIRLQLTSGGAARPVYARVVRALRPAGGTRSATLPSPRLPAKLARLLPASVRAGVKPC